MRRSAEDWEQRIGDQVKALRIRKNLTQDELALRAGVSKSALYNLENSKGTTLKTLVSVLAAMDECGWLENLAPEAEVSPIQIMKLKKPRQRVRQKAGG